MDLQKLCDHMAAAMSGIDLNRPTDPATQAGLRRALNDNLVLCIRGQRLAPTQFRDAMARFGTPMLRKQLERTAECAEVNIISSEDRDELGDGRKLVNGASWHTDDSFMREPCSLTMLYGVVVPSTGGDTQFVNMYAAYEALPEATKKRIDGLRAIHAYDTARARNRPSARTAQEIAETPDVEHPLVRTHPDNGRKALYLNFNRLDRIVGMARAESDALLDELAAHCRKPEFHYGHQWAVGDAVIWDNRATMHRVDVDYPMGEKRVMQRVLIEGDRPF